MEWSELQKEIAGSDFLPKHFQREFIDPTQEFMSRGCKKVRSQLVQIGTGFGSPEEVHAGSLTAFCQAIELLHTGTLILDDIQDGSQSRRGQPSLHLQLGFARAMNLGSWLFVASQKLVETSVVDLQQRLRILELLRDTLYWGHVGQSVDLGINMREVGRNSVKAIVEHSHRLKTASVTGLAVTGGALLAGADHETERKAFELGERVGMILQKLDDIKNLRLDVTTPDKRFEDLRQARPSYVWQWASRSTSSHESLVGAVEKLPDEQALFAWLKDQDFFANAFQEIDDSIQLVERQVTLPSQRDLIHSLFAQLKAAVARTLS